MAPYREAASARRYRAEVAHGSLALEVGGESVALTDGRRALVLAGGRLVIEQRGRRRTRRRERTCGADELFLTRGVPGRALALWRTCPEGEVERVWGVEACRLLDDAGLAAGRALDQLAGRLGEALAERGQPGRAIELGRGGHRVLVIEEKGRLVVHARPLFRERPRRCFEVAADGSMVGRHGPVRGRVRGRYDITVGGDRIRFADPTGDEIAQLFLPWIAAEDREELCRRFGALIDPADEREISCAPVVLPASQTLSSRLASAWPLPLSRYGR